MLEAGRTEMVAALCRRVKRFHLGSSTIKTANLAYEGARQGRWAIDVLKLVMEAKDSPVDAREQRLHIGRCARDDGFQLREALPK